MAEFIRQEPVDKEKKMRLLCARTKEKQVKAYFGNEGKYKEKEQGYFTVTAGLAAGSPVLRMADGNGHRRTYFKAQKACPVVQGLSESSGKGV